MPHTRSAKRHMRKSDKQRTYNRAAKRAIKTQIKSVEDVVKAKPEALKDEVLKAIRKLDKAAARRVIHPNQAARKKSQLARLLNKSSAPAKKA